MGPLYGVRIVEFAGLGPTPFCATMLADAGAEVIRIESGRPNTLSGKRDPAGDPLLRNRLCISLDLKHPQAKEVALRLLSRSDALLEGFRPGVMERLGLGPAPCLEINPRLVYARITGWGQSGPLAQAAGHDLNYIAISGSLHAIGLADHPVPPLNLIGDFGGGGMMAAFGVAAALWQANRSGKGQVIDAAMSDGATLLMAPFYGMVENGSWTDSRQSNILDGASPFYGTYRCADGNFISFAALEPKFYELFLQKLGLNPEELGDRSDRQTWPALRRSFEQIFQTRSRADWCALLEGTDACFAPVLGIGEAHHHPHHVHRGSFVEVGGSIQPAPAPRFSGTPARTPQPKRDDPAAVDALLANAGFAINEIEALRSSGAVLSSHSAPSRTASISHD